MSSRVEGFIHPDNARYWPFPDVSEFKKSLEALGPDMYFKDWGMTGCPISYFLKYCGWENPSVFAHGYWYPTFVEKGTREDFRLAPWAAEFSWLEDKIKPRYLSISDCFALLENPLFDPSRWENGKSRPTIRMKKSI